MAAFSDSSHLNVSFGETVTFRLRPEADARNSKFEIDRSEPTVSAKRVKKLLMLLHYSLSFFGFDISTAVTKSEYSTK